MPKALILNDLADNLGLSIYKLEQKIGVSSGVIKSAIERNADITPLVKMKITSSLGNINPTWLETGTGEMFLDLDVKLSSEKEVVPIGKHTFSRLKSEEYQNAFEGWEGVPMYNAPVTASFVELYRDEAYYKPTYYLHDPRFKQCNFGAIITGDSMHAEIRHGDHVICQEILDWTFVVYGDIYYIVSKNGLETCKYLNADPKNENNFLLVPRNENISPSPIPKNMILKMYKVRGVLRGY